MRLETVAEGIERPQKLLLLRRQGCTTGQGYHFSPPVPAPRIEDRLAQEEPGQDGPDEAGGVPALHEGAVGVLDGPGGRLQVTLGSPVVPVTDQHRGRRRHGLGIASGRAADFRHPVQA